MPNENMADKLEKTLHDLRTKMDELEGKSADFIDQNTVEKMKTDLADKFRQEAADAAGVKALEDRLAELETKANRPGQAASGNDSAVEEYKQAFINYVRNPDDATAASELKAMERKATETATTSGGAGGYGVPQELARTIGQLAQDASPMRQIVRVINSSVAYEELLDLNGFGHEWRGETDTRNQTNTPNLGQVTPTFGTLSAKPETTVEALEDLFFDVEGWLAGAAAREFAIAEGNAIIAGDGTNKPTGFLSGTPVATGDDARAFGVLQYRPTGQAAALSANPFDELRRLTFDVKAAYRQGGRFTMNSNTLADYAVVKDSNGQYLLERNVQEEPNGRIFGYGVTVAEDMPNVAADAFPVAFGDFEQGYVLNDLHGLRIIRDNVTKPGYVRYIISRRLGGTIRDSQAIKLLKVASN